MEPSVEYKLAEINTAIDSGTTKLNDFVKEGWRLHTAVLSDAKNWRIILEKNLSGQFDYKGNRL